MNRGTVINNKQPSHLSTESMLEMDEKMDVDSDVDMMDIDTDYLSENICNNYVYVDLQGFRGRHNRFICKEFSLLSDDFIYHALIKSPYNFNKLPAYYQRQAKWLTNHYHGIKYDCGDKHIIEVKQTIFPKIQGKTILVKGAEKILWLKYIFRDCGDIDCVNAEDLDDFDFPRKRTESYDVCEYHSKIVSRMEGPCAMSTVLMLQDVTFKNTN